jgi:hypothetical protein
MQKTLLTLTLGLLLAGCSSDLLDQINSAASLNPEQIAFIEQHVETTMVAENELSEAALLAGYGELDLTGASYDPPTADNDWVGTITRTGEFSFGEGQMLMRFTALGDGVEVDPYSNGFNPADYSNLVMDSDIVFTGVDKSGVPFELNGDLMLDSSPGVDTITTAANGEFHIDHGEYATDLAIDDVTYEMDRASQEFQDVTGDISGRIDVPGLATDALFNVAGEGTSLLVSVETALTQIDILVDLS